MFTAFISAEIILVQSLGFAHSGLDVEALHVLPVLLEQRHQEVHGQADVLHQLVLGHLDVAHGDVQAEDLLHLELDGGLEDIDLLLEVIRVCHHGGELASLKRKTLNISKYFNIRSFKYLVQPRSQEPGDLLDKGVRAEESVIALGELLHLLLVLVELLEVVSAHGGDVLALGVINVLLVTEQTHLELPPGDVPQPKENIFRIGTKYVVIIEYILLRTHNIPPRNL